MSELVSTAAHDVLGHYLTKTGEYWDGGKSGRYQVHKVLTGLSQLSERDQLSPAQAIDYVFDCAQRRADGHLPTIYIGGRGGSGSHWLAEMLHDLGPFVDAGEVAFPSSLRRRLRDLTVREQALVIDAIHLVHALGKRPGAAEQSIVNSRGTVHYLPFKRWEPGCFFVHLIRDPREQCVSVTYRKPNARQLYRTDGGDEGFLRLMVYLNRASLLRVLSSPIAPDYVVRFEELRADPERVLVGLARAVGVSVSPQTAADVAFQHRAENIQAGLAPHKGNLSRGSSRAWNETTSERERQILHAGLSDIIDITRYPSDDCLGIRGEPAPLDEDLRAELPESVILGELHGRGAGEEEWRELGFATGTVKLPRGFEIRLRCPGGWTSGMEGLGALPPQALSRLCLAGNHDVTDDDLVHLRSQPDLCELDLARTQITDAGLGRLQALPRLRGLNLLGSRVSDSAAGAFSRRHPDCVVAAGELWSEEWREKGWLEDQFIP